MINLPEFSTQDMYDFETYFHLSTKTDRMSKLIAHYEAYKIAAEIPGEIVECGVFKGTSFLRFAHFREILGSQISAKLIAFDVFSDDYPETAFDEDQVQREHWIKTAGPSSISEEQLSSVMQKKGFDNFKIIAGDVLETVPKFKSENPGLKISLLNIDIDFVEPTRCVLEQLYDCVSVGGVVLFDNYAGEGDSGKYLHGDTKGIDDFFEDKKVKLKKFPFCARPCYLIKE